ncbi:uncharacterized protein FIBRA_00008 [Fibroporia radiculosa]|uniref:Uncharacterized protein n=1 Tax=Fibroporia radiculosa TaxID=599839 RepID=J7RUN1_9APHY|nr:uncharacterized protein FIBRA_00008 [Fibroporia radiculosa]CCL98015.1 predicted protein [Fibroporia radiculosa]
MLIASLCLKAALVLFTFLAQLPLPKSFCIRCVQTISDSVPRPLILASDSVPRSLDNVPPSFILVSEGVNKYDSIFLPSPSSTTVRRETLPTYGSTYSTELEMKALSTVVLSPLASSTSSAVPLFGVQHLCLAAVVITLFAALLWFLWINQWAMEGVEEITRDIKVDHEMVVAFEGHILELCEQMCDAKMRVQLATLMRTMNFRFRAYENMHQFPAPANPFTSTPSPNGFPQNAFGAGAPQQPFFGFSGTPNPFSSGIPQNAPASGFPQSPFGSRAPQNAFGPSPSQGPFSASTQTAFDVGTPQPAFSSGILQQALSSGAPEATSTTSEFELTGGGADPNASNDSAFAIIPWRPRIKVSRNGNASRSDVNDHVAPTMVDLTYILNLDVSVCEPHSEGPSPRVDVPHADDARPNDGNSSVDPLRSVSDELGALLQYHVHSHLSGMFSEAASHSESAQGGVVISDGAHGQPEDASVVSLGNSSARHMPSTPNVSQVETRDVSSSIASPSGPHPSKSQLRYVIKLTRPVIVPRLSSRLATPVLVYCTCSAASDGKEIHTKGCSQGVGPQAGDFSSPPVTCNVLRKSDVVVAAPVNEKCAPGSQIMPTPSAGPSKVDADKDIGPLVFEGSPRLTTSPEMIDYGNDDEHRKGHRFLPLPIDAVRSRIDVRVASAPAGNVEHRRRQRNRRNDRNLRNAPNPDGATSRFVPRTPGYPQKVFPARGHLDLHGCRNNALREALREIPAEVPAAMPAFYHNPSAHPQSSIISQYARTGAPFNSFTPQAAFAPVVPQAADSYRSYQSPSYGPPGYTHHVPVTPGYSPTASVAQHLPPNGHFGYPVNTASVPMMPPQQPISNPQQDQETYRRMMGAPQTQPVTHHHPGPYMPMPPYYSHMVVPAPYRPVDTHSSSSSPIGQYAISSDLGVDLNDDSTSPLRRTKSPSALSALATPFHPSTYTLPISDDADVDDDACPAIHVEPASVDEEEMLAADVHRLPKPDFNDSPKAADSVSTTVESTEGLSLLIDSVRASSSSPALAVREDDALAEGDHPQSPLSGLAESMHAPSSRSGLAASMHAPKSPATSDHALRTPARTYPESTHRRGGKRWKGKAVDRGPGNVSNGTKDQQPTGVQASRWAH